MTINSEKLDKILDDIEAEVGGENRGDLIFRADNGTEFDFEITDTSESVNIYHDSILMEEVSYVDNSDRFEEAILDVIFPFMEE